MGLTLTANHSLTVVALHGLDDLCGLRVRHNPARHRGTAHGAAHPQALVSIVAASDCGGA